ncbi:MAG: M20/M25/M40 family metallo-hydrolase [Clostridiales Family XIII bacterium]|nr:M20/M25/M40 family metallo-hydrolase [Clostridiales Family XIII bacterium]
MKEDIIKILKELVAIPSISSDPSENSAAEYIHDFISRIPYFRENPDLFGMRAIDNDPYGRHLAYALVKGRGGGNGTVILTGHYDVVSVEDFGSVREYAFDIEALPEHLAKLKISDDARRDLESGEWIFGRGSSDMKSGLAIFLDYIAEYAQDPNGGNLLFLSVPDEESYSVGMRKAAKLLLELREKHDLQYKLLINGEPSGHVDGKHVLQIGTAGKCMPVVLIQGKKAHIGECFEGLNPLGVLYEIFSETELSTEFSDVVEDEVTPPPTWTCLREIKESYDASIPLLAAGYMTAVSYYTTPEQVMNRIRAITEAAFARRIDKMRRHFADYNRKAGRPDGDLAFSPQTLLFSELRAYCEKTYPDTFGSFYEKQYREIGEKLAKGELNYPEATLRMVREVLAFSQIMDPVAVLAFAPPFYPAMLSSKIPGKEKCVLEYFDCIRENSKRMYGIDLKKQRYLVGLCDCSYAAVDSDFRGESVYIANTPLWGDLYDIDFPEIRELNIPCLILGPYGKDFHQISERTERFDLCERIPALVRELCKFAF